MDSFIIDRRLRNVCVLICKRVTRKAPVIIFSKIRRIVQFIRRHNYIGYCTVNRIENFYNVQFRRYTPWNFSCGSSHAFSFSSSMVIGVLRVVPFRAPCNYSTRLEVVAALGGTGSSIALFFA